MSLKIPKQSLVVILVEPAGALNLGSVARLCANFEVNELRLVEPKCNPSDKDAKQMAVKGSHLLEKAQLFPSLLDAIADCEKVIATCGRIEHGAIPLHSSKEALTWLLKTSEEGPIGLVFGREDRGLSNNELQLAQKVISIETAENYPSLNLSHAVGIVLHELHRFKQEKKMISEISNKSQTLPAANPVQLNDFLNDAQDLLLEVGFLLEHTSKARMSKIRAMLQRAEIRTEEVSLLRGIVRQIRWAIRSRDT